jgi:hypothetical protein
MPPRLPNQSPSAKPAKAFEFHSELQQRGLTEAERRTLDVQIDLLDHALLGA